MAYHSDYQRDRDHPICKEVAAFFRKVNKAQKKGIDGVRAFQEKLRKEEKKINGWKCS